MECKKQAYLQDMADFTYKGMKPYDYDAIMQTNRVRALKRKNKQKYSVLQKQAISELGLEGIPITVSNINARINELCQM